MSEQRRRHFLKQLQPFGIEFYVAIIDSSVTSSPGCKLSAPLPPPPKPTVPMKACPLREPLK